MRPSSKRKSRTTQEFQTTSEAKVEDIQEYFSEDFYKSNSISNNIDREADVSEYDMMGSELA
jgi:hypothetical protein